MVSTLSGHFKSRFCSQTRLFYLTFTVPKQHFDSWECEELSMSPGSGIIGYPRPIYFVTLYSLAVGHSVHISVILWCVPYSYLIGCPSHKGIATEPNSGFKPLTYQLWVSKLSIQQTYHAWLSSWYMVIKSQSLSVKFAINSEMNSFLLQNGVKINIKNSLQNDQVQ